MTPIISTTQHIELRLHFETTFLRSLVFQNEGNYQLGVEGETWKRKESTVLTSAKLIDFAPFRAQRTEDFNERLHLRLPEAEAEA